MWHDRGRMMRALIVAAVVAAPALAAADTQRWSGDGFVLTAVAAAPVAGAALDVRLELTPRGGYQVNDEYPTAIEVIAPADVAVAKAKLGRGDGSVRHERAVFRLALTPKTAGAKRVGLKLKFALCTDATCEPRKQQVELLLSVK